eukprot:jgi/Ulvmu1/8059/UM004_0296.1
MASLKALKSVFLQFATNSPCAGLYLLRRLQSPKLAKTNPDCIIDYKILPSGSAASLKLTFADGQKEELDITRLQAGQVYDHIASRIEEKAMTDVLTQNNFVGKKLATNWGL